ncbi:hypothetical protein MYX77_07085 [Acidobacteriia bacterium AH_259_A11_L15]|nr:hypothetical protein [Acidobacteriia bacterium AH_259_A11_L15]
MGSRRAVVYLLLVFLLGFAGGGLASYWAAKAGWFHRFGAGGERGPLKWLTRELDLTPEQQEQLKPILDKTGQEYFLLYEKVRPEFEQVRQQTREKIRALLTPEQRARFEELVREMEEKEAEARRKYGQPEEEETPEAEGSEEENPEEAR